MHRSGNRSAVQYTELFVRIKKKVERKESEERDLFLLQVVRIVSLNIKLFVPVASPLHQNPRKMSVGSVQLQVWLVTVI